MTRSPFVLMYHSVGRAEDDPFLLTVTPERLAAQLAALRRQGLSGLSMRALRAGGRGVGLTFDDGYADFLEEAVPILRRFGATATVFALPGRLGGRNDWDTEGDRKRLMTADELRAASAEGMEVASHGLRHVRLPDIGDSALAEEVADSRLALEDILGQEVDGFAYPYGAVGEREVEAVRRAGYGYACAVDLGGSGATRGHFALPRSYAGERDGSARFVAKRLRHAARAMAAR